MSPSMACAHEANARFPWAWGLLKAQGPPCAHRRAQRRGGANFVGGAGEVRFGTSTSNPPGAWSHTTSRPAATLPRAQRLEFAAQYLLDRTSLLRRIS